MELTQWEAGITHEGDGKIVIWERNFSFPVAWGPAILFKRKEKKRRKKNNTSDNFRQNVKPLGNKLRIHQSMDIITRADVEGR